MRHVAGPATTVGEAMAGAVLDHAPALSFLAFACIMAALLAARTGRRR